VENNQYIRPNIAHPNQLGHDLIAGKLHGWIQAKHYTTKTALTHAELKTGSYSRPDK